jgi:hypothetical protein
MKSSNSATDFKSFFVFYGVYLGIVAATAQVVVAIAGRDHVIRNWVIYSWIAGLLIFVPLLLYAISIRQGTLAKWLRLIGFYVLRVETFAIIGLLTLMFFTGQFLGNLFVEHIFYWDQIVLNIPILNVVFMFVLALIVTGKLQVKRRSVLLIQNRGHNEIYLFQNGVIRQIPDNLTLKLLGYSLSDVVQVSDAEFNSYSQGAAFESVTAAKVVQVKEDPQSVWIILGDTRRYIPDKYTLDSIVRLGGQSVETVPKSELDTWKVGDPLVSLLVS